MSSTTSPGDRIPASVQRGGITGHHPKRVSRSPPPTASPARAVAVLPDMVPAAGGRGTSAALDFAHAIVAFVSIGLGVLVGNAVVLRLTSRSSPRRPEA